MSYTTFKTKIQVSESLNESNGQWKSLAESQPDRNQMCVFRTGGVYGEFYLGTYENKVINFENRLYDSSYDGSMEYMDIDSLEKWHWVSVPEFLV